MPQRGEGAQISVAVRMKNALLPEARALRGFGVFANGVEEALK